MATGVETWFREIEGGGSPLRAGQTPLRQPLLMMRLIEYYWTLQIKREWWAEIYIFFWVCWSVTTCWLYLFHTVLLALKIWFWLPIDNFGGCFENTWPLYLGGRTDGKKGIQRGSQMTSMPFSDRECTLELEFTSSVRFHEDSDVVFDTFDDMLEEVYDDLPSAACFPVRTSCGGRNPQTRRKKKISEDPLPRSPNRPSNKRPYRKRKSLSLLEPSIVVASQDVAECGVERRGRGRRIASKGKDQQSLDPPLSSLERVVPRSAILFTPPETRLQGRRLMLETSTTSPSTSRVLFGNTVGAEVHDYPHRPGKELAHDGPSCSSFMIVNEVPQSTHTITPIHSNVVKISLVDMQWGGELLEVPCAFAIGQVLQRIGSHDDENPRLLCDFGADFGLQEVRESDCTFVDADKGGHDGDSSIAPPSRSSLQRTRKYPDSPEDCSSGSEWNPDLWDFCSSGDGYSSGASDDIVEPDDQPTALLRELGVYGHGPAAKDEEFMLKYNDTNWHAKTWSLLPRHPFSGPTPGPTEKLGCEPMTPAESFLLFWDKKIQRRIVHFSNAYANYIDPQSGKRKGGVPPATPITSLEYRQFCGIVILMGIRKQPAVRDYWRRSGSTLHCADVVRTMSRYRFLYILRCLYMVPKGSYVTDKSDPAFDPIGKCRWILDAVIANSKALWNPGPYITVDECMVRYNGRFCSFKQYMPMKPITHGIKLWILADSSSKFVWNMEVYVGALNERRIGLVGPVHMGMGAAVVTRLTAGMEGKYYRVAVDNFFSSVQLFDSLLQRGFYAVGTSRQHRKGFPTSLNVTTRENRGTLQIRVHRDRQMAAIHWSDTKGVHFLSTAEDPMHPGGVSVLRNKGSQRLAISSSPIQVAYSQNMRGVDVSDQLRGSYSVQIATKKWWHRVYFFAMDTALTNAYVIYRERCNAHGNCPKTHRDFQLEVAYSLMGLPVPAMRDGIIATLPPRPQHVNPGTSTPGSAHTPHATPLRRVCFVCSRRTTYICRQCGDIRLCLASCFNSYHEAHVTL